MKILHIIPIQNCLQFDTITMILAKGKSKNAGEEEQDNWYSYEVDHYGATRPK